MWGNMLFFLVEKDKGVTHSEPQNPKNGQKWPRTEKTPKIDGNEMQGFKVGSNLKALVQVDHEEEDGEIHG